MSLLRCKSTLTGYGDKGYGWGRQPSEKIIKIKVDQVKYEKSNVTNYNGI